ncbi:hypothetical protein, partial [Marisediminitalea sp.]|uniref:hypothetical protein n=1 Tax=Marisediminitalea sp. TaxID=2662268 RepID=UPI0035195F05
LCSSLLEVAFATADQLALVSAWYWVVNLFLAKRIITLYHAGHKLITKDQHALSTVVNYGGK